VQDILSTSPNRELTYWLREGRSTNAEVDYVLALNGQIIPIEIKANDQYQYPERRKDI
jgi:hypothetical protein